MLFNKTIHKCLIKLSFSSIEQDKSKLQKEKQKNNNDNDNNNYNNNIYLINDASNPVVTTS